MSLELLNLAVFPVQIAHSHIAVKFSESKNSSLLFFKLKKAIGEISLCENLTAMCEWAI